MGDRANVVVKTGDEQVCLYTHWLGGDLKEILTAALKRGESRWDDAAYLARVIFCEMVRTDPDGTTGFGISQSIGDGDNNVFTVDVDAGTVAHNGRAVSIRSFVELVAE
jgi:hypothetical protein